MNILDPTIYSSDLSTYVHVCVHLFVRRLKYFLSSISLPQEQMIQFNTAAKIPFQLRADAINPSVSPQRHPTSSWIYLQPPSPLFSYNQFILKQFGCHPGLIKLFHSAVPANLTQSPRKKSIKYHKTVPGSQFAYDPS